MSDVPRITYSPRPDATLESERNTLASVYRFILDCHMKKIASRDFQSPIRKEVPDEPLRK